MVIFELKINKHIFYDDFYFKKSPHTINSKAFFRLKSLILAGESRINPQYSALPDVFQSSCLTKLSKVFTVFTGLKHNTVTSIQT